MSSLLARHADRIKASGVSDEVGEARGYYSVEKKSELAELGFGRDQCPVPALVIPVRDTTGEIATYLVRPDWPRMRDGRPSKYVLPRGSRMVIDVPELAREHLRNPARPLFITEGAFKADAGVSVGLCCISLTGVWCWRGTNEHGGKTLIADFEAIAFNNRETYVVFDSDVMTKESVHAALERLVAVLEQRKAKVRVVYLPSGEGGTKVGLDDFLAAGNTVDDLLAYTESKVRPLPRRALERVDYVASEHGLVWNQSDDAGGVHPVPLTNFGAQIVADVMRDDGVESQRFFEIQSEHEGRTSTFRVPAKEYQSLEWVAEHVGAGAIVGPGYVVKEHTRVAIQAVSGEIPRRIAYAHLGWTQVDNQPVYLHAGGGIGPDGPVPGIEVDTHDRLELFELPEPPEGEEVITAIRASLSLLEVASAEVAYPTLAAVYRAPLGSCDHAVHLTGTTGLGKSAFAALAQQHWGAAMEGEQLPASWSATANYLEGLTFAAKDVLLVIDDLVLGSSRRDVEEANRKAERLYRAQGNRQGRGRMKADATLRSTRYPRGLACGTSEDLPAGHSLRARVNISEFSPHTLDWEKLTELQDLARAGLFAQAMAAYVRWLAADYEQRVGRTRERIAELRKRAYDSQLHRRTPSMIASLQVGFQSLLEFAQDAGAIGRAEASVLERESWKALGAAARAQLPHHAETDHPRRFLSLLASALTGGWAHLADDSTGGYPDRGQDFGWRRMGSGPDDWRQEGPLVGWTDGKSLYLDLDLALGAAQRVAGDLGQHLAISPSVLAKGLHERGQLMCTDLEGRGTYKIRRTFGDRRRQVLHLSLSALEPDQRGSDPTSPTGDPTSEEPGAAGTEDRPGRTGRIQAIQDAMAPEGAHTGAPQIRQDELPALPPADQPDQDAPCPYPQHRDQVWTSAETGLPVCGVCHPPAYSAVVAPESPGTKTTT